MKKKKRFILEYVSCIIDIHNLEKGINIFLSQVRTENKVTYTRKMKKLFTYVTYIYFPNSK